MKWIWTKFWRLLVIALFIISVLLSASCASAYNRLNNFNGQFSMDYPKDWQFASSSSDNVTEADFTGSISKSTVNARVFSKATEDFGSGFILGYKGYVSGFLSSSSEWSDKLVIRDATLKNGTIFSVFGRQIDTLKEYLYVCGLGESQTVFITVTIDGASDNDTGILNGYCEHMVDSLQGLK